METKSNTLTLQVQMPALPEWMEKGYAHELEGILFRIIHQNLKHPHENYEYAGYMRSKLLIPLWLAFQPDHKQVEMLVEMLAEDLNRLTEKVEMIHEVMSVSGEEEEREGKPNSNYPQNSHSQIIPYFHNMKTLLSLLVTLGFCLTLQAQSYSEVIDTFYVPSPEFSTSLGLDSLYFPCAITTPDQGSTFPLLILVHGSSSLNKDALRQTDYQETPGGAIRKATSRMFFEIADSLSRKGIMVLRYDKRSFTVNCIEQPSCWFADTITPYDYIKDLNFAIEFGKTLPGVDTCNIFVAGHSQGGSFVADVGVKRADIRGVIGLAPTAQPVDSVVIFQTRTLDNDPVGALILKGQFDSLRAGLWGWTDTLYNQKFSPDFGWIGFILLIPAVITQKISDVPTLFMYGSEDNFSPPSTHMQIWMDSITRPDVSFRTLTCSIIPF